MSYCMTASNIHQHPNATATPETMSALYLATMQASASLLPATAALEATGTPK